MMAIYSIGISGDYKFEPDVPGFSNLRHSGYFFAPAMMLCAARLATAPDVPRISMLLLALNTALSLWFGSRGPFVGLIGGLAVAAFLFPEFRRLAFSVRCGAATLAGTALSVVTPSPKEGVFNALRRFIFGWRDTAEFSSGRTELWQDAVRMIGERPVFGHGGEQFQYVSPRAGNFLRHPHDFVLQVIFDWGLIGGAAFLVLLALWLIAVLKTRRQATVAGRTALFGAICMFCYATIDGIMFYPFTIGITLVLMIVALVEGGSSDKPAPV
jgi:O-antigen ligase